MGVSRQPTTSRLTEPGYNGRRGVFVAQVSDLGGGRQFERAQDSAGNGNLSIGWRWKLLPMPTDELAVWPDALLVRKEALGLPKDQLSVPQYQLWVPQYQLSVPKYHLLV